MRGRFGPKMGSHQWFHRDRREASAAYQCGYLVFWPPAEERQPIMYLTVLVARFHLVPKTLDQHDATAGPQQIAPGIECGLRMRQRPQHVALDDQVEARGRQVRRLGVGLDKIHGEAARQGFRARLREHRGRHINARDAMAQLGQQQRQEARTTPNVERVERRWTRDFGHQPIPCACLRVGERTVARTLLVEGGGAAIPMLADKFFHGVHAALLSMTHIGRRGRDCQTCQRAIFSIHWQFWHLNMSLFRVCEFWLGKSPNKWVFRATRGKSLRVDPSTPAAFVRDEQTLSKRKFVAAQWSSSTSRR